MQIAQFAWVYHEYKTTLAIWLSHWNNAGIIAVRTSWLGLQRFREYPF